MRYFKVPHLLFYYKKLTYIINYRIMYLNKVKDRPGTDQTLKLVSYNSYKEFMAMQESTMP